jgi:hypothetical protein
VRILLDECIDHRLAKDITDHEVSTVARMGWGGRATENYSAWFRNGSTSSSPDRNLISQQNFSEFQIAVLILAPPGNRLADLRPLVPKLLRVLPFCQSSESKIIGI